MFRSSATPSNVHPCGWDWCREVFDTADRLARHVLDDHVANEVPIKREEMRIELRAFDGTSIGDETIRTSLLMREGAFLDDEEKDGNLTSNANEYATGSPVQRETAAENDEEEEPSTAHVLSILPQNETPASPLSGPDTLASTHTQVSLMLARHFHTPPPSPARNGFQALSAASTCSPDSASMAVAPSPSIAEMLANTINSVHRSNREGDAGPSTMRHVFRAQSRPPSTSAPAISSQPSSTHGKRKSTELQSEDQRPPLPVPGRGSRPSSNSRTASRSRSRTPPNAPHKQFTYPVQETRTLSPIAEATAPSGSQNGIHPEAHITDPSTFPARPLRTGSIRLEPDPPPPETVDGSSSIHNNANPHPHSETQPEPDSGPASAPHPPPEPDGPYEDQTANSLIDIMDLHPSSPDPSIPVFTQAFDVQNQSQWPLATQAPYSFDSQLTLSSQ